MKPTVEIATVGRWERGERLPQLYYRQKLCALFGQNAQELDLLSEVSEEVAEADTLDAPETPDCSADTTTRLK